jgi:hypothetical protein
MELTINIKEQKYIASFLNLIRQFDYVEIIDVKEDNSETPVEHKILLDERLKRVEEGKTSYKNWDLIKKKYEGKGV